MKTNKTTILNDEFARLVEENYINCEENYSYGELIAIQNHFEEKLIDVIKSIYDFEEATETLHEIVMNTIDDVRLFFDLSEYEEFYCNVDEEEKTVEMYDVPKTLKEHFNDLLESFMYKYDFVMEV